MFYTGDSFYSLSPGHYVQIRTPTDRSWELIDLESTATTENKAVLTAVFFASAVLRASFFWFLCFLFIGLDFRHQYITGRGANKLCLPLSLKSLSSHDSHCVPQLRLCLGREKCFLRAGLGFEHSAVPSVSLVCFPPSFYSGVVPLLCSLLFL